MAITLGTTLCFFDFGMWMQLLSKIVEPFQQSKREPRKINLSSYLPPTEPPLQHDEIVDWVVFLTEQGRINTLEEMYVEIDKLHTDPLIREPEILDIIEKAVDTRNSRRNIKDILQF